MMKNPEVIRVEEISHYSMDEWRKIIIQKTQNGARISSLFGTAHALFCILSQDDLKQIIVLKTELPRDSYPGITPECPQAHLFEREIKEECNINALGHPWLKPVRGMNTEFYQVQGNDIHEVAVGPVHAGTIEPGHFRFQCHGEDVIHLEIALGYQYRGIEKALQLGPNKRTIHYMETAAGDTSIGHSMCYSQLIEALCQTQISNHAHQLRAIGLELERLANHTGDLGALASDIGYLPTASYCGRLRGDFLNLTALICGSRLGRGLIRPGGVQFDIDSKQISFMQKKLHMALREVKDATSLLWESPSVLSRFEGTGPLTQKMATDLGMVGITARACGLKQDIRRDQPFGIYVTEKIQIQTWKSGDVFSRAFVRWLEIQESISFILRLLNSLSEEPISVKPGSLEKNSLVVSMVEGWRGEICHVGITNNDGKFSTYKIVDPSFHNWIGLSIAMRNQQISDFPLCNKSFNLSYCGHDL